MLPGTTFNLVINIAAQKNPVETPLAVNNDMLVISYNNQCTVLFDYSAMFTG